MAANITETNQAVLDTITGKTGKLPTQNGLYWAPTTDFIKETGPLTNLYKNKYVSKYLTYPRDLGSDQKLHSVQFSISQVEADSDPIGSVKKTSEQFLKGTYEFAKEKAQNAAEGVSQIYESFKEDGTSAAAEVAKNKLNRVLEVGTEAIEPTLNTLANAALNQKTKFKSPSDVITLYMPDTVEFSQSARYNQIGPLEAASSVPFLGKIPSTVLSAITNQQSKVSLNSMGYVFNPQEQVLFEGIDFRTFSMSFTFTPYSSDESLQITNIIKAFRKNSLPTIQGGGEGGAKSFFFVPPAAFDISFYYGNSVNRNIPKLKRCVLTEVGVNYGPNGTWSTFNDGMPVQTNLTLNFKEIELVDSTAVDQGY